MNKIKLSILSVVLFGATLLHAQESNTLYFLENSPMRHYINPAFEPLSKMYLSLPVIGYTTATVGNNSLTMSNLVYQKDGKTMTFLHPDGYGMDEFLRHIRPQMSVNIDTRINLLSFGFSIKDRGYFHLNINERVVGDAGIPKGLMEFALGGGMQDINGGVNSYDLKQLQARVSAYTEFAFGYSHQFNQHWGFGMTLKFLYGTAYANMTQNDLRLDASADEWALRGNGYMQIAAPLKSYPASIAIEDLKTGFELPSLNGYADIMELIKPNGLGGAIDLGITYKPIKMLQISAAVTDLGFIRWNKGQQYNYDVNGVYDGVGEFDYGEYVDETGQFDSNRLMDTVTTRLTDVYSTALQQTDIKKGFNNMLSPTLNVGVDANFWGNRVGVGVYSRTKFVGGSALEELIFGAAFRPFHWLQLAASYSLFNGKSGNIGAALGIVTYEGIGLTLTADYIPLYYAHYDKIPLPYKTSTVNIGLGLNIVIGHNRDKDKDGVRDAFDLCPDTPRGMKVNDKGCPIDEQHHVEKRK